MLAPFIWCAMRIMIVGEAWGAEEEKRKEPFVGPSGYELTKMLSAAGIHRGDCYLTNVFNLHPKGNDITTLCGPKAEAIHGYPVLTKSKWVHRSFQSELDRLQTEILSEAPNIIIALGNTAMWALLGKTAITKFRGTTAVSTHTAPGYKVLPTYHPAAVLRQWELRPITVMDLSKAARESAFPDVRRPEVIIHVPETPQEILQFAQAYINDTCILAVDIETSGNQITCIGLAPSRHRAIVIPFHDYRRKNRCYWEDRVHEKEAWTHIRSILVSKRPRKVFQNGLYDIAFLWRSYGIGVRGAEHDTMLLHHALQPESLKGLGFLGSVYAGEHGAWKEDRKLTHTIKRDE